MELTLVIFSGLPGTGKSTLADRLARKLCWPLLRMDDVAGNIPSTADFRFWDEKVEVLMTIIEAQLELGISVIADSVFMGTDRIHAQEIARKHKALFRPIYCFVSDEILWEKRVTQRVESLKHPDAATWDRIQHQRQWFAPWQENTALFVDAINPFEKSYAKVLKFATSQNEVLKPIKMPTPFIKGSYHA